MSFKLHAPFPPAGDQPDAIRQLTQGILDNEKHQTLLGVTGSGKTFTIANVIQNVQRPTLVLTHNKTLVAQLYGEFKQFFPENAVGYFVSYYDYYQPEAYMPVSGVYIEKDLSINDELDKLRLQATAELLSGRRDIIVVASVSCIYGIGNPTDFENGIIRIAQGQVLSRQGFLHSLVNSMYNRSTVEFTRGTFRVQGDTIDINLPYVDYGYRVSFFGDEIESIETLDKKSGKRIGTVYDAAIFPANLYLAPKDMIQQILAEIQDESALQVNYFKSSGKFIEAQRLSERVNYDVEMIRELGYCNGVENYSRFFDRRLQHLGLPLLRPGRVRHRSTPIGEPLIYRSLLECQDQSAVPRAHADSHLAVAPRIDGERGVAEQRSGDGRAGRTGRRCLGLG